jgi:hypothetical protein
MYIWPVLLPALSNREDFLTTVGIFDDNTGEAIDFSGRVLAAPGDFTAAAWTVTDGAIITTSATSLTIKDYPFGNEMQAISLTVGQNLGILAGDPVTIADTLTGLNTMTGYVTSYAPSTGALVVQVGSQFDFEIRAHQGDHCGDGFGDSLNIGVYPNSGPIIRAQLGSGIMAVDTGRLQIRIPASTVQQLRHRTYGVGLSMFDGYDTRQIFIGKLPVLSGGVSTMPIPSPSSNPYGLP